MTSLGDPLIFTCELGIGILEKDLRFHSSRDHSKFEVSQGEQKHHDKE